MAKIKKIPRENLHKYSGGLTRISNSDPIESKNVPDGDAEKRRRRNYTVDPMSGMRPRKPRVV